MQDYSDLESFPIFNVLDENEKREVFNRLEKVTFQKGEIISRKGDPGISVFMISSGIVDATIISAGNEYRVDSKKKGDIFGELSLFTGEPRSSNTKAATDVVLYELKKTDFEDLSKILPAIKDKMLILLAKQLKKSIITKHLQESRNDDAIIDLISRTRPPEIDHYPGISRWAEDLNRYILELSNSGKNVLVTGSPGTEKSLVAELIHFVKPGEKGHLLFLNCGEPPPVLRNMDNTPVDLSEKSALLAAQEFALFGTKNRAADYGAVTRKGYLELASGGTLVLENADRLLPKIQKMLAGYLASSEEKPGGKKGDMRQNLRIIATASQNIESMVENREFNSWLFDNLREEYIEITPLRKRKKDIQVIAEEILNDRMKKEGKNIEGFSREAISVLVDYEWPLNYEQLKQVIYRAVALCNEKQIRDEHLILDIFSFSTEGTVNLLNFSFFQKLVNKNYFPTILKNIAVPVFIILTFYMILGPDRINLANIIIWSIWWPSLLFLNAIAPRSWCSVCPLPDIGSGSHLFMNGIFAAPPFLKKYAQLLGITGFFLILSAEYFFHMFENPPATGYLLLAMFAGVSIMGFLWGKRAWCKYLCPLGRMLSLFSPVSLVELRSNKNICLNQCKEYHCIKDDNCPMGIHPSTTVNNYDCVFCLSCVKKCPYDAIHISGRVPWKGVLEQKYWQVLGGLFAVLITGSVLAERLPHYIFKKSYLFHALPDIMINNINTWENILFPALMFGYPIIVYLFNYLLLPGEKGNIFTRIGYAYLPLAFFGLFSIYFREFIKKGPDILPLVLELAGLQGKIPPEYTHLNLGTLKLLFPLIALSSLLISIYLLKMISEKVEIPLRIFRLNRFILILTALLFLFIL